MATFNFDDVSAEGSETPEDRRALYNAASRIFVDIVHRRPQIDPNDQYSDYTPPLTKEALELAEAAAHTAMVAQFPSMSGKTFTCSECGAAPVCSLAFNLCNTDGDCLMEK